MGKLTLWGFGIALALAILVRAETTPKTIVFLGDSLSAGYGVKPNESFPALIGEKIRAAKLPYEVENAGLSGDTTAGGLRRIDWLLQRKIDVLVIELGGNDGLRGLPVAALKSNIQSIIDKVRVKNSDSKIVIAGMRIPPNLGAEYARDFEAAFPDLAQKNNATLIPFLLEGVGGMREFNQADSIHPTAEGHRAIAETVWRILEPLLQ
ncbi:MAG: arylesterase [Verrucomicrobiota bacterium]|nr:arylesterase [Verrucomicrobiota bacterium]MDQ6938994.1 arylesterase [Verrucomicrobiota bacterium]